MPTPDAGWTLVNPATEEPFLTVEFTRPADLERLLTRARAVQRQWREVPVADRVRIVGAMVPAFRGMAEAVAGEITRQMGKPLGQARAEIETMIDRAETMGRLAAAALADEALPDQAGFRCFIRHEPLGLVLDIAAWNYPLLIAVNVIVPALLAGNAVLIKHARLTPLCADHFVDAFDRTDLPRGLVAAIRLDHEATARLIRAGRVDHVSFTGSTRGGREIHAHVGGADAGFILAGAASPARAVGGLTEARPGFIDLGLELGGKDPDFAVESLVDGAFYNAGQSCRAVERIYVARPLFARFVEASVALVRRYRTGDSLDSSGRARRRRSRHGADARRERRPRHRDHTGDR